MWALKPLLLPPAATASTGTNLHTATKGDGKIESPPVSDDSSDEENILSLRDYKPVDNLNTPTSKSSGLATATDPPLENSTPALLSKTKPGFFSNMFKVHLFVHLVLGFQFLLAFFS